MKKFILFLAISISFGLTVLNANADTLVPGQYGVTNGAIGNYTSGTAYRSQVEIVTADRVHANYVNKLSGAGRSYGNSGNGGGVDFQFGSSQTENIWKQ